MYTFMKKISPIGLAALINLLVFVLFFILFFPIYNSGEDVHILYMLSGGYGDAATAMTHYNHIDHPFLAWSVKGLFEITNSVNWYSIALLLAHYIATTSILGAIIRYKNNLVAYLSYAVLFLVFEGNFLLFPDFTGASIVLTIAGLLYLLTKSWYSLITYRHCLAGAGFLLAASFYRIHAMAPVIGMALPFFAFTLQKQKRWKVLVSFLVAGVFIFLSNQLHQYYYQSKKSDWHAEEIYRQKVFRFFNEAASLNTTTVGEKWHNEHEVVTQGLILDTSYMPVARLDSMYNEIKKDRMSWTVEPGWGKWFYINNRIFIFSTALFFLLYAIRRKLWPAAVASSLLLIVGFGYLQFTAKAPPYILISCLEFISFAVFMYHGAATWHQQKNYRLVVGAVLLSLLIWASYRLYKTGKQNKDENYSFRMNYAEIAAHPKNLFIDIGDFRSRKFYVFDRPANYPFYNYLIGERFINNTQGGTLKRFGISKTKDIFSSRAVLFWGEPSEAVKKHFERIAGRRLLFRGPLSEFKRGSVWRVE